jgi:hypothetical protein
VNSILILSQLTKKKLLFRATGFIAFFSDWFSPHTLLIFSLCAGVLCIYTHIQTHTHTQMYTHTHTQHTHTHGVRALPGFDTEAMKTLLGGGGNGAQGYYMCVYVCMTYYASKWA